mgnify:CR=1 FL=1
MIAPACCCVPYSNLAPEVAALAEPLGVVYDMVKTAAITMGDRVAIVGMGCTPFGEHWNKGPEDLLVDAAKEAYASAGIDPEAVDAYWLGTMASGLSGLMLSEALKLPYKPVTRLENMCATGSEAIRNAAYAVAAGAYDLVMAIGVEKLKDSGYSGLPNIGRAGDGTQAPLTAPAMFSLLAPAYAKKYGLSDEQLKEVMTRIAWKNHRNGALNPRAQFRKEVPRETIACSPLVAGPLGIFDCSGVSDGAAAAIIVRAEDAHRYNDRPLWVKALSFIAGPAAGPLDPDYDYTTFPEVVASAADAYAQLRRLDPQQVLSRTNQEDLANHYFAENRFADAAESYELFLKHYGRHDSNGRLQLILGLIYARYLGDADRARSHLLSAIDRLHDPNDIEVARAELQRLTAGS